MTAASSTTPVSRSARSTRSCVMVAFGVGLDQRQQVLDQRAHPPGLEPHPLHRPVDRGLVRQRAGRVQVGVAADRRDRGAQLVRGVGDELPQPVLAAPTFVQQRRDAVQHVVEGDAQPADLGARVGLVHPAVQVAAGDVVGRRRHRLQRPQLPPDDQAGGGAQQDQQPGGDQQFDQDQPAGRSCRRRSAAPRRPGSRGSPPASAERRRPARGSAVSASAESGTVTGLGRASPWSR